MTAAQLVRSALRLIEVIGSGGEESAEEAADGLAVLQALLASWSAEELTVFASNTQSVSMTADDAEYTLATRPQKVLSADVLSAAITFPVEVCGPKRWAEIGDKNSKSLVTKAVFCDYGFPDAVIKVAPIPLGSATLRLYCTTDLATLASGAATFSMPPGYERAVRFNLAVDLCAEWGKKLDPTVATIATQSKQALQALNASNAAAIGARELQSPASQG